MIACLPMYDRPELRWATDALWGRIAAELQAGGIDAPAQLSRLGDYSAMWSHPDLLLGMTCGKPYRDGLHQNRALVATYDYGLDGCPAGHYNSHIVVAANSERYTLADCEGSRFCFNGPNSESGYSCARRAVDDIDAFCGDQIVSGAHQRSTEMVANNEADFAAIDACTWRYIVAIDPSLATRLRIIQTTPPVPGLPFITARPQWAKQLAGACQIALEREPEAAQKLGIIGMVSIDHDTYLAAA